MGKKVLKTITLGYDADNPSVSLCPGHVGAREFNAAYKAEGWHGDRVRRADLFHEYWIRMKRGWIKATIDHKKAVPVTVMHW